MIFNTWFTEIIRGKEVCLSESSLIVKAINMPQIKNKKNFKTHLNTMPYEITSKKL